MTVALKPVTLRTIRKRRAELVAELKSGKHNKGKGRLGLMSPHSRWEQWQCCLGVASEVCIVKGILPEIEYRDRAVYPEQSVRDYYAFLNEAASCHTPDFNGWDTLAGLNDTHETWEDVIAAFEEHRVHINPEWCTDLKKTHTEHPHYDPKPKSIS